MIVNKAAAIERCVKRAREEYMKAPDSFDEDHTRQDAAVLNIQRACEAAIDMGLHVIRKKRLGVPQGAADVFVILANEKFIDGALAETLVRMVGFRNIAVHDNQALQMPIVESIITKHLDDFLAFSHDILTY